MSKTKLWLYIALGLAALVGYLAYRSFDLGGKLGALEGQNTILRSEAKKTADEYAAFRQAAAARDAAHNAAVEAARSRIAALQTSVADKAAALADLKKNYESIRDCPTQVANLQSQVALLEFQGADFLGIIVDKDVIIAARDAQIADLRAALVLSDQRYQSEYALRLNTEAMNAKLRRDLGWARFGSNVKTVVIVGELAVIGYLLISK